MPSIAIPLLVWLAPKGSKEGGGCHEATDHSCGNGIALSGLFYSCTDQGFGCDRCTVHNNARIVLVFLGSSNGQWSAIEQF